MYLTGEMPSDIHPVVWPRRAMRAVPFTMVQ